MIPLPTVLLMRTQTPGATLKPKGKRKRPVAPDSITILPISSPPSSPHARGDQPDDEPEDIRLRDAPKTVANAQLDRDAVLSHSKPADRLAYLMEYDPDIPDHPNRQQYEAKSKKDKA